MSLKNCMAWLEMNKVSSKLPFKEIQEICSLIKGKKPNFTNPQFTAKSVPYILIESFDGVYKTFTEDLSLPMCKSDDVLMVMDGARSGLVAIGLEGAIGSTLAALRIKDKKMVNEKYFYYFLKTKNNLLNTKTKGAAIPHMDKYLLRTLPLPLPPLEMQIKIAAALERVDLLKQKREQANLMANKILQAVFLKMFGNPISNPRKWKLMKLSQVGTLARGKSKHRPRNAPELLGGKYPLIQTGDIANCEGYIRNFSQTYSELGLKQSKIWKKGTLCITIAANIALTGILTFDACFPDSIVGFLPNNYVRTEYIQYWLSFLQKALEATAPKSAQRNINLRILSNLDVPTPPIELQNEFASIVAKIEQLKQRQQCSSEEIQNLFDSLMSKAFKGELLPEVQPDRQGAEQNLGGEKQPSLADFMNK